MCSCPRFKYADRTVFVFGLPRSGTTWLAKILDSHPDTIYRHEPALSLGNRALQADRDWFEHPEEYVEVTSAWLNQLAMLRNVRTVSTVPVFRKSYRTWTQHALRSTLIRATKAAGLAPVLKHTVSNLRIPDFIDIGQMAKLKWVIKSINPGRNLPLFLSAAPESRYVFILRDPRSQIASTIRGLRKGRLRTHAIDRQASSKQNRLELVQRLAREWRDANQKAIEYIANRKNCYLLRHEDLVCNPDVTARNLFSFCGLDWHSETAAFLKRSMRGTWINSYFSLRRDPDEAMYGWRSELSPSEVEEIRAVVMDSEAGKLYPLSSTN